MMRTRFVLFLLALLLLVSNASALELSEKVNEGLDLMNHGKLIESYSLLKNLHSSNPKDVQTSFILALVKFRIMWLSTFNAADRKELVGLLDSVDAAATAHLSDKDMLFYHAAVKGMKAQLVATEGDWWQTAQLGKDMKKSAEQLKKMDATYSPADYLLGSYNYFADAISGTVKFVRSLFFIPGGDRAGGIRQLLSSYQKPNPVSAEAGRTLVLIYVYYEKEYPYGIRMADNFLARYPGNLEVGLYKGVGLYFNQSWTKSEEWLRSLRGQILDYSHQHVTGDRVVDVYLPMERETRYWIARTLFQEKRYDEARAMLNELADSKVDQPYWLKRWVYLSLAQMEYLDGKSESAERYLAPVLKGMDVKDSHKKAELLRAKKGRVDMFAIDFQ